MKGTSDTEGTGFSNNNNNNNNDDDDEQIFDDLLCL